MTKLDASGAALVYSTYLGGSGDDDGHGIAVDGAGSAYVTGDTARRTSRRPRAPSTRPSTAAYDAFVTKLDASGAALVYSTYLGGSGDDHGDGIAVDGAGSAYLTGDTARRTSRRPRAPSTRPSTASGDAFVTKLNASGAALGYSTYLGGSSTAATPASASRSTAPAAPT